ncbi:MAG: hypothetical protein IJ446_08960 [Oscillospiraceae bacterium]|nr:hypothetical protein [Oscillospiraceae bacterium]
MKVTLKNDFTGKLYGMNFIDGVAETEDKFTAERLSAVRAVAILPEDKYEEISSADETSEKGRRKVK